ncbi:hypothetical protein ACFE04_014102 [Oxalis oulophora]
MKDHRDFVLLDCLKVLFDAEIYKTCGTNQSKRNFLVRILCDVCLTLPAMYIAFVTLRSDGEREFMFYRNLSGDMLLQESELDLDLIIKPNNITLQVSSRCSSKAGKNVGVAKGTDSGGELFGRLTFETALKLRGGPAVVLSHSLGAPFLGAPETVKASLSGVRFGLPIFEAFAFEELICTYAYGASIDRLEKTDNEENICACFARMESIVELSTIAAKKTCDVMN